MTYNQAIAEAYASADLDEVILDTLELRHPAFVDDEGNPTAVRLVVSFQNYSLRLENNAPQDGGQYVTFTACPFTFQLPEFGDGTVPQLQIKIDNVSREITKYLEEASTQLTPIGVTYRPYLASDPTQPQMDPPFSFTLSKVTVDVFQATGTATTNDVNNWPFPYTQYTPTRFPGLVR
jgi:Domain of unknown function (DUF1833)